MSRSEATGRHPHSRPAGRWRAVQLVATSVAMVAVGTGVSRSLADNPSAEPERSSWSSPVRSPQALRMTDSQRVDMLPKISQQDQSGSEEWVEVPESGRGTFDVATSASSHAHAPRPFELTYTVEVEAGLSYEPAATAAIIDAILDDPRGWSSAGNRAFHRVAQDGDIRVVLATPNTTDKLCAPLRTRGQVSCRNGELVVLNARRWAFGTDDYQGALPQYRTYLVNHEVGHALGYGHVRCPGDGKPAPVMQQQTLGLNGCRLNPWPHTAGSHQPRHPGERPDG